MSLNFLKSFLDLIFPKKCFVCKTGDFPICSECRLKFEFMGSNICKICGNEIKPLNNICLDCSRKLPLYSISRSVFRYTDAVRSLILLLKFKHKKEIIDIFTPYFIDYIAKNKHLFHADFLVSIPQNSQTDHLNLSKLLCEKAEKNIGIKYCDILIKTKDTPYQSSLKAKERLTNLIDCFDIKKDYKNMISGKNILIIDDIITTKSTINNISETIMKYSPKEIKTLSLARAVINK